MALTRAQLANPICEVTDSDYDAIESAIMESSRGRWFLAEYARRNRHANTQLLLSAINNIKETLDSFKGTSPPYLISTQVSSAYCADQVRTPPIPRRISEVGPNITNKVVGSDIASCCVNSNAGRNNDQSDSGLRGPEPLYDERNVFEFKN
jgi:hypothetical protein